MQLSETEMYVIKSASCKYVEKSWNQVNLFLAGFNNLKSQCLRSKRKQETTNKMAKHSVPKFFYDAIYSDLKNFALDSFF